MIFKVESFQQGPLELSKFIEPLRLTYELDGVKKSWEAVKSHDSVAILLYHEDMDSFVLVKQFRAPVYMNDSSHINTYELCAGIIDKDVSLEQIAKEEIYEECGYEVDVSDITKITSFFTNVGVSGSLQHLFFAKLDNSMRVHDGGGIHDENIVLEYLSLKDSKEFIYDESKAKTPGLMFAFYWFFEKYNMKDTL